MEKEVGNPPFTPCDSCNSEGALLRCSKCKCSYYCSSTCQRNDWKKHKIQCAGIQKTIADYDKINQKLDIFAAKYQDASFATCSICYEPMEGLQKVQLPCHHIFCMSCMAGHSNHRVAMEFSCPLCRQELSNESLYQQLYSNACGLLSQALRVNPRHSKPLRLYYAHLALEEFHRLQALLQVMKTASNKINTIWMIQELEVKILTACEEFQTAKPLAEHLLDDPLYPKQDIHLSAELIFCLSECYIQTGQAEESLQRLFALFGTISDPAAYTKEIRSLYQHLTETLYLVGRYDQAISIGSAAVEMNRHFDGVYEFIWKAYWASNQRDQAVATIKKALRYETPWDHKNVEWLQREYEKLEAELSSEKKKETDGDEQEVKSVANDNEQV